MSQVTVITGPERRRRWPVEERLRILEAADTPGAVVADVARLHDVATSLIYKWRRDARADGARRFLPVSVSGPTDGGAPPCCSGSTIVVDLPGGARVTIGGEASRDLVGATLKALR